MARYEKGTRVWAKSIAVKVDEEAYEGVTRFAQAHGVCRAEAVRTMIEWGLEAWEKEETR